MRLAWVTPSPPYPPDEGARIVTFNRVSRLHDRGHELHVLSTIDGHDSADDREMQSHCTDVEYCPRNGALSTQLRRPWIPHLAAHTRSDRLQSRLAELEREGLDAVFVEYTPMAAYARDRSTPTFLGVHNVEYRLIAGMAQSLFPSPKAAAYAAEAARLFRYERAAYRDGWADAYAFLSTDDRRYVTDRHPDIADRTLTSPVGVDVDRFTGVPYPTAFSSGEQIVFTGSMSYEPNVDAARWFVRHVLPRVRERRPEAEFFIVGKNPAPTVRALDDRTGVTVTGRVNDVEPYIAGADVIVVPLRQGGGVKIKLLEALAAGRPIVTTDVGIEGTDVEGGSHVFLADDAATFAAKVGVALEDPDRGGVRESGHRFVRDRYDWNAVVDRLEAAIRSLVTET